MPDWVAVVRDRLGDELAHRGELVAELAGFLEDAGEDHRRRGASEAEAAREVLAAAGDWSRFRREIETLEGVMRDRIRAWWLPGVVLFLVVQLLLRLVQLAGYEPATYFLNWLHPLQLYLPWLAVLPALGALAALWTRGAGRPRRDWMLLALFPSLVYAGFVLFATVGDLLVDVVITGNHGPMGTFAGTWTFGLQFLVFPGLMLALGAGAVVLFAKDPQRGHGGRADADEVTSPDASDGGSRTQSLAVAIAG